MYRRKYIPSYQKFLYSDHEIFLRELISNATDATLKLKHLSSIGEVKEILVILKLKLKLINLKKHCLS